MTGSTDVVAITLLASLMKLMNKLDFIDYDTDMKWYEIRTGNRRRHRIKSLRHIIV